MNIKLKAKLISWEKFQMERWHSCRCVCVCVCVWKWKSARSRLTNKNRIKICMLFFFFLISLVLLDRSSSLLLSINRFIFVLFIVYDGSIKCTEQQQQQPKNQLEDAISFAPLRLWCALAYLSHSKLKSHCLLLLIRSTKIASCTDILFEITWIK